MAGNLEDSEGTISDGQDISRKRFLRWTGLTAATGMLGWPLAPLAGGNGRRQRERISRILREYDAQGDHRTGTSVDAMSARWLAHRIRAMDVEASLEALPFSRTVIVASYVESVAGGEAGGSSIQGVPLFDAPATGPDGITGTVGPLGSRAHIGMLRLAPYQGGELTRHRQESKHRAIIVVTGGEAFAMPEGLALFNAPAYRQPFGSPVLQVGSDAWPRLQQMTADGATVRLVAHSTRQTLEIFNVTATVTGTRPDLAPLMVMTPRSGWWTCASERGGGIAVWLEMIRHLQRLRPARSTHFLASTGHELGHYGLDEYLRARKDLIRGAVAWIHLGANFGAALGAGTLLQTSDEQMQTLALGPMKTAGCTPDTLQPPGDRPLGEAVNIHEGGGRYISILGRNRVFHHQYDRWPAAVDPEAVLAFAKAFAAIGARLTEA